MRVRGLSSFVLATLVAGSSVSLPASTGRPIDIPERARGAGAVVVAHATEVTPVWQTNAYGDLLIVSQVHLQVEEVLKGTPAAALWLQVEGGSVNGVTLRVSDLPSMAVGDRGVFFVDAQADGTHVPHLKGLGILKLNGIDQVPGSSLGLGDIRAMVRGAGR